VDHFFLGLLVVILGGMLNSTFALPMKYSRSWKWENTWFVFTLLALLLLPAAVAVLAVPRLAEVYAAAKPADFVPGLAFGFLWGLAQTTFGLSIAMVGMAMAFAIVVGLAGLIGSFLPMIVLHPEALLGPRGIALAVSAMLVFIGLAAYSRAAREREAATGAVAASGGSYRKGLALCLFTGILGGMINLGFAFSGNLSALAAEFAVPPASANFAVWLVVLSAGWIPNAAYTLWLMARNRTFVLFAARPGRDALLAAAMSLFWLSGVFIYGAGSTLMGKFGTSIGWAVNIIVLLLWSTTLGLLTGEWRGTRPEILRRMKTGVAIILASVVVLSATGLLPE